MLKRRPPLSVFFVLVLLLVAVAVYGYFTSPLPFGLSRVISTPGGTTQGSAGGAAPGATATPGGTSALALGQITLSVQQVQRDVDLTTGTPAGPPGRFAVVWIDLANSGRVPVPLLDTSFELTDAQGRVYNLDVEASTSACATQRERPPLGAGIPPGGSLATCLAFQVAPDASGLVLLANLGAGAMPLAG